MVVVVLQLTLFHVNSCKILTFCDFLHEIKQKMQTISQEFAVRTGNHKFN